MSTSLHSVKESVETRKPRGAFFTPQVLADFVSAWAVRSSSDTIFEPSCGEAAFLLAAARAVRNLGEPNARPKLSGVDIFESSVHRARELVDGVSADSSILVADFFSVPVPEKDRLYDVVVGNPPYIRYQQFSGESRAKALLVAQQQGVKLSGLASSWAAFVVHSSAFLKPDGRLGLVVPAELLSVNYAAAIRRFLLSRFSKIRLVLFEDRVFPDVQEEVVLLLAEGTGGADSFEVYQAKSADDLARIAPESWMDYSPKQEGKWTAALVPRAALHIYRSIRADAQFNQLSDWGSTYLGAVTGKNEFFTLSRSQADKLGIQSRELVRIAPAGAAHLKSLQLSTESFNKLVATEKKCFLFAPCEPLSDKAAEYVQRGERDGVDQGYKCSQRTPWWRVPLVSKPDFIFTYMNHLGPQLVENEAGVHILNGVYGFRLKQTHAANRDVIPVAFLNSLSLLGAEVVGRSFGGGLLKHEPRDVDQIPFPSIELVMKCGPRLELIRPEVALLLRGGRMNEATKLVDLVLLIQGAGLRPEDVELLQHARAALVERRLARGKNDVEA